MLTSDLITQLINNQLNNLKLLTQRNLWLPFTAKLKNLIDNNCDLSFLTSNLNDIFNYG